MKKLLGLVIIFIMGCEPFVTEFSDTSDAVMYEASSISGAVPSGDTVNVVTWNIRFGIGRFPFFGDSCGDSVILDDTSIEKIMAAIADSINVAYVTRDVRWELYD